MKTLVTGSAGFIGRRLMIRMAGPAQPFDIAYNKRQDVRLGSALQTALQGCRAIVHLAAVPGVDACNAHPHKATAVNSEGTWCVLHTARATGIQRVIFASTAAADRRDSLYGWTKFVGEQWCQMARELGSLDVTVLRLADVYGPGSIQKDSVVAHWMRRLLYTRPPSLKIRGGEQLRDFVYVDDVVDRIALRLEDAAPWDDEPWHYLGTRRLTSVRTLAEEILATGLEMGADCCDVPITTVEAPEEPLTTVPPGADKAFDCDTELREGLRATWAYFIDTHARAMKAAATQPEHVAA